MSDHLDIWAGESTVPSAWERWADEAERVAGVSLDGDQIDDGYSLDDAYEQYLKGQSAEDYGNEVAAIVHDRESVS